MVPYDDRLVGGPANQPAGTVTVPAGSKGRAGKTTLRLGPFVLSFAAVTLPTLVQPPKVERDQVDRCGSNTGAHVARGHSVYA